MTLRSAQDIAGDRTGFYPESLKVIAKKYILEHGSDADKKILQRATTKNVVRLGDSKVQRLGEYNETTTDNLNSIL